MQFCSNKILASFLTLLTPFIVVSPAFAAAPDGVGPWADNVLSASQGLTKDGSAVPAIRSNTSSALGVAEDNTIEGNFYSLGFGGKIALGFDNGISSGVILVEATNENYPTEKAKVEVSENGTTWVNAGEVSQDGTVNKPAGISCAKYVRVTDTSNPADFAEASADGYDVDGVRATGEPCTPPTGGNGNGGNCTSIKQVNNAVVVNSVGVSQNSGNNKSKNNTGGKNKIVTGGLTTNIAISNTVNSNTASTEKCPTGNNTIIISGNGAGSHNTATIKVKKGF